jgi:hypothetical protein
MTSGTTTRMTHQDPLSHDAQGIAGGGDAARMFSHIPDLPMRQRLQVVTSLLDRAVAYNAACPALRWAVAHGFARVVQRQWVWPLRDDGGVPLTVEQLRAHAAKQDLGEVGSHAHEYFVCAGTGDGPRFLLADEPWCGEFLCMFGAPAPTAVIPVLAPAAAAQHATPVRDAAIKRHQGEQVLALDESLLDENQPDESLLDDNLLDEKYRDAAYDIFAPNDSFPRQLPDEDTTGSDATGDQEPATMLPATLLDRQETTSGK